MEGFVLADDLVPQVYLLTRQFPSEERFGLQSQLRRGAVSVAANLVEGCARSSARDYLHFVTIAIGSASEMRYLVELAGRLGFADRAAVAKLIDGYDHVARMLQSLVTSVRASEAGRRTPDAGRRD